MDALVLLPADAACFVRPSPVSMVLMVVDGWFGEAPIAFINNGGIRSSISEGSITREDVFNVMPFNNTVDKVTMDGFNLKELLEDYAYGLCANASCYAGTFLQMSGLRVTYDIYEDNAGNRVTRFETR